MLLLNAWFESSFIGWNKPFFVVVVDFTDALWHPSDNADDDDDFDVQQSLCWAFQFKEPPSSPSPLNQKLAETIQKRPLHSLLHSLLQLSKAIFADAARKHTTMVKCAVSMDDQLLCTINAAVPVVESYSLLGPVKSQIRQWCPAL